MTFVFFFNDTAATEIYTLSLHDALPILMVLVHTGVEGARVVADKVRTGVEVMRSEEHTSELQSRFDLVCRLLLEKKKKAITFISLIQIAFSKPRVRIRSRCTRGTSYMPR